jgi:hypothetical protein
MQVTTNFTNELTFGFSLSNAFPTLSEKQKYTK